MRKLLFLIYCLLLFFLVSCIKKNTEISTTELFIDDRIADIEVYTTKGDMSLLLSRQPDLKMVSENPLSSSQVTIELNEEITYQEVDGFGAALTESSAYLINTLVEDSRNKVIKELFSDEGIRMNFIRLPMGASDFALSSYTYNDLSEGQIDKELNHFSIARDEEHVIPILKDAFKLNPDIKLLGSPWSAPAWMKTSGDLNYGSLKSEYYSIYSQYFLKFIKAYESHGLPIYAVTIQNEPLHEAYTYPSMKMLNTQQLELIQEMGPLFVKNDINTKIIAYDHNWDNRTYSYLIYNDQEASKYVAGTAFHCYAGDVDAQSLVHNAYPDKGIWFTECSGGEWSKNFANNLIWNMENLFIGSINNFSKSVLLWNIALDENFGPQNGGCKDCRGVIKVQSDGTITKNVEYYSIGHFSKFVDSGAKRIDTEITGHKSLIATAFKNPNGNLVLVMCNTGNNQLKVLIKNNGLKTQYNIPNRSVSTLIIQKQ